MPEENTPQFYYIKNWWKYQHYKDRNPPWIKLHRRFFSDPAVQSLTIIDRYHLLELWIAASELDGSLPLAPALLARSCHLATHLQASQLLARLKSKGLVSKIDIRGDRPSYASGLLAPKTETYKEETEKERTNPRSRAKTARFTPPSLVELSEYMKNQEFEYPEKTAEKFIDYYETRGWKPGNSKVQMKSWKAAVRTWKSNHVGGNGNGNKENDPYGQFVEDFFAKSGLNSETT